MAIYKGLNVAFYLGDVDNLTDSLRNLGLDIDDLERIRGLGTNITTEQLHLLSGLDIDQEKENYSLYRSSVKLENWLVSLKDISKPLDYNLRVNNQLRASALKYNFLEFGDAPQTPAAGDVPYAYVKSADISTSRVSSWSKLGSATTGDTIPKSLSPVFYGADVLVNPYDGVDPTTGDQNKTVVKFEELVFQGEITPKRFLAEEPTDLITININGVDQQFYAMRAIPIQFEGFWRTATFDYIVDGTGSGTPAVVFVDLSQDPPVEIAKYGNATSGPVSYTAARASDRRIDFYYKPDGIERIIVPKIQMIEYPETVLQNMTYLDIQQNDLSDMPDFSVLAPALQTLNIDANGLNRSTDVADTQLQKLPPTIRTLNIRGCFSDSTPIDLTHLPQLRTLNHQAYWDSRNARFMTGSGTTPEVNPASIVEYNCNRQTTYRYVAWGVATSTTLQTLDLYNNDIIAMRTSKGAGSNSQIALTSPVINYVNLGENRCRVLDMRNKTLLRTYYHYNNYGSADAYIDANGNGTGESFFKGCTALQTLNLQGSYVRGNIGTLFRGLTNLSSLELWNTRLNGELAPGSFQGTTALSYLRISYSNYNSTNFFGNDLEDELNPVPDTNASPYGGGFYVDKMKSDGNVPGVSTGQEYYLVVSDKSREGYGRLSDANAASKNFDGYSDWRLPTRYELELMYRKLKPSTDLNSSGQALNNQYSIPPYNPAGGSYPSTSPGKTQYPLYQRPEGSQSFEVDTQVDGGNSGFPFFTPIINDVFADYWTSVADGSSDNWGQNFTDGEMKSLDRSGGTQDEGYWRFVRAVPVKTGNQIQKEFTSATFSPVSGSMTDLRIYYNRNIKGKLPNMNYLIKLYRLIIVGTGIDGPLPDFSFATKLADVNLYDNYFNGVFPGFNNNRISSFQIHRNKLTGIGNLASTSMWRFNASYNLCTGPVPYFADCTNLYDIYLNNNNFNSYDSGSIASNKRLRRLYLNNNNLTKADALKILEDAQASYEINPRSGTTINLLGNSLIKESEIVTDALYSGILEYLRNTARWTILLNA